MKHRFALLLGTLLIGTLAVLGPVRAQDEESYDGRSLEQTRIAGVVESIDGQIAYIRTDDGESIGIQLGPESYWQDRGYRLRSGTYVTVDCWYDPYGDEDWYFAGSIWGPGFYISLTNDEGVPFWVTSDDYYYGSYGPCSDTFVIWYDCTPTHYIYLPLPPPYYRHYYGPHWRYHYRDWHTRWYRHRDHWRGPPPRHRDWGRGREPRGGDHHDGYRPRGGKRDDGNHGNYNNGNERRNDAPPPQKPPKHVQPRTQSKERSDSKSNTNDSRRDGRR